MTKKRLKIGVDIRALAAGRQSGVEAYTVQFLTELFRSQPENTFVLFYNAYHDNHADLAWATQYSNVVVKHFRIPNKLLNLSLWYLKWPKLDRLIGGVDYFFVPNINFCAVSKKTKLIVTMHDLSFEHFKNTFSFKRRLWHFFVNPRALAKRAWRIIAVSDATRDDIVTTYRVRCRKVVTIHSAVHERYQPVSRNSLDLVHVQKRYRLPYRFILFLGTIEPRKNITGLVYAYEELRRQYNDLYKDVPLIIVGNPGWCEEKVRSVIRKSKFRKDIRILGFVDEKDKPALYSLAHLFVYPSLFEGFGLPPLEAMACGAPVVTSNNSSIPEVVGNAALLVDPDRPEDIMAAMHAVLSDAELRAQLSADGLTRAQDFAWSKAAAEFQDLIS